MAGIKLSNTTKYDIIDKINGLKEATFSNGFEGNDFVLPNVSFQVFTLIITRTADCWGATEYNDHMARVGHINGMFRSMSYTSKNTTYIRRNVCSNIDGEENSWTKLYWMGRSYKWNETWYMNVGRQGVLNNGWWGGLGGGSDKIYFDDFLNLQNPTNGYNENLQTQEINKGNIKAYNSIYTGIYNYGVSWARKFDGNNFDVSIEKVNDKQYYNQSLSIDNAQSIESMYASGFLKTYGLDVTQTLTSTNLAAIVFDTNNVLKNSADIYAYRTFNGTSTTPWKTSATNFEQTGSLTFDHIDGTNKLYTIGYLGQFRANQIYKWKENKSVAFDKNYTIENPTLNQGMPLFAAKKDGKVEWTAVFDSISCYNQNNVGTWIKKSNENEIEIYLSKSPFSDGVTPSDATKGLIKPGDGNDYWLTSSRTKNIKFTMDEDSIVYMKCRPHQKGDLPLGLDKDWTIVLNIDGTNGQWKLETQS